MKTKNDAMNDAFEAGQRQPVIETLLKTLRTIEEICTDNCTCLVQPQNEKSCFACQIYTLAHSAGPCSDTCPVKIAGAQKVAEYFKDKAK